MPSKLLLISLFGWLVFDGARGAVRAADLQIEHVTIVSPERATPKRDASVRVHDGRIVAIEQAGGATRSRRDATVIDGAGLFLTPGLIDSHVHLGDIPGMTPEQEAQHPDIAKAARDQIPRSYLLYGFTTLIDLISAPQGMARWRSHDIAPDVYFCGGAALMDGYSMNYAPKPQRYQDWPYMLIEPGTQPPDGIDPALHTPQAVVAKMKSDGAICVKTFFERGFGGVRNLPVPKLETIRAVVKAAHAAGMPVLMHANSDEAHRFGIDAGVDILAHGMWNLYQERSTTSEVTPGMKAILDEEIQRNIGLQPTMQVLYGLRDVIGTSFLSDPRLSRVLPPGLIDWYRSPEGQWFHLAVSQGMQLPADASPGDLDRAANAGFGAVIDRGKNATAYMIARHGRILFGTDTPSAPTYANPPGLNGWLEMHRLIDAGETPAQIFKSATLTNARALKLDRDIGTVQIGKRANFLLLRQDPTQTIDAYAGIAKVILNGRELDPSELAAQAPGSCTLPADPGAIPAAIDAAITGPADKDRACMKALFIPEARLIVVSIGADGAPSYTILSVDDWIARVKARGDAVLEEKQLKFQIQHYGSIVHLWSTYALHSGGQQVARGINSIQAIKESGGWRVMGIMWQTESASAPLPKEYLP